jgi:hypothetical protein
VLQHTQHAQQQEVKHHLLLFCYLDRVVADEPSCVRLHTWNAHLNSKSKALRNTVRMLGCSVAVQQKDVQSICVTHAELLGLCVTVYGPHFDHQLILLTSIVMCIANHRGT